MLIPTLLFILVGFIAASTKLGLRSNLEYLEYDSKLGDFNYRLTDAVYPHEIHLELDMYLNESEFKGIINMVVEVKEANLVEIVLHQNLKSISVVYIQDTNNHPIELHSLLPYTNNTHHELLMINLASPIAIGNYTITIYYTGVISENPFDRGFYKGYYFLNNTERVYATTQFEPYHARKVFPCFDEPRFKSVYTIAITRDANFSPSYSNMPIAKVSPRGSIVEEKFHQTPIMSAYLVAFHVSDFVETKITGPRPFKIISRPGVLDQHLYAAEIGVKITNTIGNFLRIQYQEMAEGLLMKNDHIALPDFPSGAMKNWGMANYREAHLLYDEANTNLINKIFITRTMAHELAHQWFGNLVTCFWWSNLWLHESFASFFGYFAAHWADPSLELDDQFTVDVVHIALAADALSGATPMNWQRVANKHSITLHFSTTSYEKGASVLKMLEHFVGVENFRTALSNYLRKNAYEIGTPEFMYTAFKKVVSKDSQFLRDYPNVDIKAVFESWVDNPGSPLLNVNFKSQTGVIFITQQRFLLTDTRPNTTWQIPLTWTHEQAIDFTSTKPRQILTTSSSTIQHTAGDHWVIFNIVQSGLYRVNYDEDNWRRIAAYLHSSKRENIHKLNRAQIVNDVLYFIRSGDISSILGFEVLDYLRSETDYFVWAGAIGQLDWFRRRFVHIPSSNTVFTAYLLNIMETVIQHLGYDERPTDSTSTILNRMQIMDLACNLKHTGCVSDALNKWRAYRQNDTQLVPVNLRRYVYCVGLREGNASDYQFLLEKYETSENTADMVVILRALACTKNEASIKDYLRQSLDNRKIRIHDRTNAWNFALQGNRESVPIALNFLYQNYDEMRTKYGGEARLNIVLDTIPAFLTDYVMIQKYQHWVFRERTGLAGSLSVGVAGVNTAISNLGWGNAHVADIHAYVLPRISSTGTVASTIVILVMAICFVCVCVVCICVLWLSNIVKRITLILPVYFT